MFISHLYRNNKQLDKSNKLAIIISYVSLIISFLFAALHHHIKLHNNFVCNLVTLNILLMINFINSHLLFLSHNTRYIFIKYSLYLTHQDVSIKIHLEPLLFHNIFYIIQIFCIILYNNKNIQNK